MSRLTVCLVCDEPKGWRRSPRVESWCSACGEATPSRQLANDDEPIRTGSSLTFGAQRALLGAPRKRKQRQPARRKATSEQLSL